MRNRLLIPLLLSLLFLLSQPGFAQSATGTLQVTAHISPTGGHPEPVRQFTLYVLTMSYTEIQKQVAAQFPLADRDEFISKLKISPELKAWMQKHEIVDLTAPDTDKLITPDDVMNVPEFFAAYQRSNSGGVTKGLPVPKYRETDAQANPAKYQKLHDEYLASTKKFIENNPTTIGGMETELSAVNPKYMWDKALQEHIHKVAQASPEVAQTKYMVVKGDTDLDGRMLINGLPPGTYWVTSLGMDASAGDRHFLWDAPVTIRAGQPAQLELSNLNGIDIKAARP